MAELVIYDDLLLFNVKHRLAPSCQLVVLLQNMAEAVIIDEMIGAAYHRERVFRERTNPMEYNDDQLISKYRLVRFLSFSFIITNNSTYIVELIPPRRGSMGSLLLSRPMTISNMTTIVW